MFVATPRSLLELCPDVALWDSDAAKAAFARMAENRIVVDGDSGAQIAAAARDNCVTVGFVARA